MEHFDCPNCGLIEEVLGGIWTGSITCPTCGFVFVGDLPHPTITMDEFLKARGSAELRGKRAHAVMLDDFAFSYSPTEDDIRSRAYQIYIESGRIDGRDEVNWELAEAELTAWVPRVVTEEVGELVINGSPKMIEIANSAYLGDFPIRQDITVLPADDPCQLRGHDQIRPGETVEQCRERLKPRGWRAWVCWLACRFPMSDPAPCPDGQDGCLVCHYQPTIWAALPIVQWLWKKRGEYDKRPWVIYETIGTCVVNLPGGRSRWFDYLR